MKMTDDLLYDSDYFVQVYTDGACLNNGKWNAAAGIGVVFNYDHPANYFGPVKGRASNNAAEIQAATWAINEAAYMDINQLRIMTDSKFLISSVRDWMPYWKCNGWCRTNGAKLANEKDFRFLDRAIRRNFDMDIEFEYVAAHSGDCFNELADQLAKEGAHVYYDMHFH